jgi:hypothetical protein
VQLNAVVRLPGRFRPAEKEQIVITRHGQPAGILVGFASEDDWFDYQLENDGRFLKRIERARASLRSGQGVTLEDVTTPKNRRTRAEPERVETRDLGLRYLCRKGA